MKRKEGACLVCGADLEYLTDDMEMHCSECGKAVMNNARCRNGHYVCDECHGKLGIEVIRQVCLASCSKNPIEIMQEIMEHPAIYMHGPEHHVLVGAALLTAYKNCGGLLALGEGQDQEEWEQQRQSSFEKALAKMESRGKTVPGGVCGMWGACGAGISSGMFFSVITGATPLTEESWSLANRMTASCLTAIAQEGGPRCCKRDSFLSVTTAVTFVEEHMGIAMELPKEIRCEFYKENKQCRGTSCPFYLRS